MSWESNSTPESFDVNVSCELRLEPGDSKYSAFLEDVDVVIC